MLSGPVYLVKKLRIMREEYIFIFRKFMTDIIPENYIYPEFSYFLSLG